MRALQILLRSLHNQQEVTLQNHFQSVWSCWTQGNPSCKCCRPLDLKIKEQNEERERCRQRYTAQKQTQEISNIPWEHTPYIQEPWQMKRLPVMNCRVWCWGMSRKYAERSWIGLLVKGEARHGSDCFAGCGFQVGEALVRSINPANKAWRYGQYVFIGLALGLK